MIHSKIEATILEKIPKHCRVWQPSGEPLSPAWLWFFSPRALTFKAYSGLLIVSIAWLKWLTSLPSLPLFSLLTPFIFFIIIIFSFTSIRDIPLSLLVPHDTGSPDCIIVPVARIYVTCVFRGPEPPFSLYSYLKPFFPMQHSTVLVILILIAVKLFVNLYIFCCYQRYWCYVYFVIPSIKILNKKIYCLPFMWDKRITQHNPQTMVVGIPALSQVHFTFDWSIYKTILHGLLSNKYACTFVLCGFGKMQEMQ